MTTSSANSRSDNITAGFLDPFLSETMTTPSWCIGELKIQEGLLEIFDDFKYLGSWLGSSKKDMSIRIWIAWKALNELKNLWSSPVTKNIKLNCFRALIESFWLYVSETWSTTTDMTNKMDGT
jgi:hypothetical protein